MTRLTVRIAAACAIVMLAAAPLLADRRLRSALRQAREGIALTQGQVAEISGWSVGKMQRIESGAGPITEADLRHLAEVYRLGVSQADRLVTLGRAARRPGWWQELRGSVPSRYLHYVGLEAGAESLAFYSNVAVSGLLQTTDYSDAIIGATALTSLSQEDLTTRRDLRKRRRKEILDRVDPPTLRVLLDESVLYRVVGDATVMSGQISWLIELARRPHIDLKVVPFEAGPSGWNQPMIVLSFGEADQPALYLEGWGQAEVVDLPETVLPCRQTAQE